MSEIGRFRKSRDFGRWRWTTAAERYPGSGSDMHWCTAARDGGVFFVDDDGENFGGPWNFAHLLRARGTPPHHRLEPVSRFPELRRADTPHKFAEGPRGLKCRRYVDGALCVDDRLFVACYDYDDFVPGMDDPFGFIDRISPHGGVVRLMYSDDGGRSFQNVPEPEAGPESYFLGPRFAGLSFVGFGPGHTGLPAGLEGHVYAISNDINWETGDHVFLARAPRDRVLDRTAWEFWHGHGEGAFDQAPSWTSREEAARPILRDPGRIGHPTMCHLPGIDRFLLTYSTDSAPHTFNTDPSEWQRSWLKRTELLVLEAPRPWGPWRLLHHDPAWEIPHTAYLPQVPTPWLDADGLGGWMVFSGDYTDADAPGSYYGFMTRHFRFQRLGGTEKVAVPSDASRHQGEK